MSKFLFICAAFLVGIWVVKFDAESYQSEKENLNKDSIELVADQMPINPEKSLDIPKKEPQPSKKPKSQPLPPPKKVKTAVKSKPQPAPGDKAVDPKSLNLIFPIAGMSYKNVISYYGDRRGSRKHEGIDIPADRGTPVVAVADGKVIRVSEKGSAGKAVWLQVGDYQFFYAHLDSWTVSEGDWMLKNEILGTVGNTGNARHTIPHLHFGIYVGRHETTDPAPFFK